MSDVTPPTGQPPVTPPPAPDPAPAAPPPVAPTPPVEPRAAGIPQPNLPLPVQPGERVLLLRRRHWMYLWPTVLINAAIAIVPTVAFLFVLDAIGIEGRVASAIVGAYLAFFVLRLVLIWYRYQNDFWVVTNQRVIDIKRNHPLNMQISTADLVNIQDMTIRRNGLLKTMLDYGDVVCQTAGMESDFTIGGVHDPRAVQALVDRERDRERIRIR
jgi:hypothetical protein